MTFSELFNHVINDYRLDGEKIAQKMQMPLEVYKSIQKNKHEIDLMDFKAFCDIIHTPVDTVINYGLSKENEDLSTVGDVYR